MVLLKFLLVIFFLTLVFGHPGTPEGKIFCNFGSPKCNIYGFVNMNAKVDKTGSKAISQTKQDWEISKTCQIKGHSSDLSERETNF